MGSKVVVTRSKLDLLADSVSAKSGESLPLTIGEMKVAVDSIVLNSTIIGDGELNVDENDYLYFEDDGQGGEVSGGIVIVSDNLHDSSEDVANTYIAGSTETAYNGWTSTGYIPVKPNTYYRVKNTPGNNYNAFYKSDKTSAKNSVVIPASSTNDDYILIKTNANTAYVRMSGASSGVATYEIYEVSMSVPSGSVNITSNGTINVSPYETAIVDVSGGITPNLQSKTVTPTESAQTITPDTGYDGLSSVAVAAIESTFVGSGITRRSSSDLTASGATVTVPVGYYASQATKSVASGTAGTPSASKGTVSNHSISVSPSVTNTTGYITGGTKTGTAVTVAASELVSGTLSITSSGTKDVTNYASASVAAGTEGTPTATKGTVSSHQVTVTPSVTNSAGYISGGTKTGTAVTVSASELVSGTKSVTANGTEDVTNYASVNVAIPFVTFYTGTTDPPSSLGNDGDIYLKVVE